MRSILAVVSGYLVFAVSAVLLFALSGRDPHAATGAGFIAFTVLYGACFGALGGYVAASVARHRPYLHAGITGLVIALIAAASWIARPGAGQIWTQAAAVFVFAPLTLAGAKLRVYHDRE